MSWFRDEIVHDGQLPLLLAFVAFIATFVVTRTIVRMIRAGTGPFGNNVSASGLHIHHVVPGVVILVVGGFAATGAGGEEPWASIGGVLVGVGAGLVLDEFALILRLDDVYWSKEGRISVELVGLAAAMLGIVIVFGIPYTSDPDGAGALAVAISAAVHFALVGVVALKGKYRTAFLGILLPIVPPVAAIRLARPRSRWADRFYGRRKLDRATRRAARSDARWAPVANWLGDTVAGAVDDQP